MRGNSFGRLFTITTFGESHGVALGVVIDGMPSNIQISTEDLQRWVNKRSPGLIAGTSPRKEPDLINIVSGIFEGKTLGTPICIFVNNVDQKSSDYDAMKNTFRVGHADQTTLDKFGIRDYRGGGRSSGRETVARVIAGYFAKLLLPSVTISVNPSQVGEISNIRSTAKSEDQVKEYLEYLQKSGDSCGCLLSVEIKNCPENLGEPVFDKLKATLAHGLLSIGGCVSFSLGVGAEFAGRKGSENAVEKNSFGGINGGISTGETINLDLVFKAPSTIGQMAKSGRHDPCLYPRVVPVIESMILIVLADHFLCQRAYDGL